MTSFDPSVFLNSLDDSGAPSGARTWSPLQEAIFDEIRKPSVDLLIQAVAGSGKTTTLVEALRHAPGSALFMAFNKSIAEDIRNKAPRGDVKTLNALGHRLWMQNSSDSKLDFDKIKKLVARVMPDNERKEWGYEVQRMVGMAKNLAVDIDGSYDELNVLESMLLIAESNDSLPPGKEHDAAIYATKVFFASREDRATFDFDDQLYMPIYLGWTFPTYANVFIDEAQDLSPIQHLMLSAFKRLDSRIVCVGDRHQAIYGFRGADIRSMDNLKTRFGMSELPLSISYRCSQNVVKEAQFYCPTIEWRDGAPEGTISYASDFPKYQDPDLFARELVVCRNNAPLFRAILRHVRAKAPCRVLSNFIESLQSWIRGFKVSHTIELLDMVGKWEHEQIEKARETKKPWKEAQARDKADTVRILAQGNRLVGDILQLLKKLGESTGGPTFATIHKAKGLEADSVYIIRPDLVPSKWAESPESKQQEGNLAYVAITRAKTQLTYGTELT